MDSPAWGLRSVPYRIDGQPAPESGKESLAGGTWVTPGFFKVYGIRLVQGRNFLDSDRPGAPPVVIINEAMAKKYWPGENPIGKRMGDIDPANPNWAEVVGVMADFKGAAEFYNPSQGDLKFLRPWAQNNHRFISFNVRTSGNPEASKDSVRKAIGLLAPDIALSMFSTVPEVRAGQMSYFTFLRRVLIQISVLGLLLAVVGIYGVVANLASERTKEIGIRMALGAESGSIIWLFLKNGVQLALIGAVIGLVASWFLLNLLQKMLPVIPGVNPWVVVCVALLLVAIAVIASWLPARRTTKIDPTIALRSE